MSGEQILWQSFDFPTDSFLPGMKLGINNKTGENWSLTSLLTASMPTPGAFTHEWIPHELQLVVKRRGVKFWTSGVLNNGTFKTLENLPYGVLENYNFTTFNEGYLTFNETTSMSLGYDGTIVARMSLGL
ncbi:hypothetical protein Dsin_021388 [Dipteronia sinensis]|uniref:Bulb-type lectin domain-containing protein n=1 Tax=Dipteronia sinensis TaxID=43782 RepID=A0AAD9ZZN9_9ROSI|nr:hypothetical protein Dsin_021388 [Dipteronia sinensis]